MFNRSTKEKKEKMRSEGILKIDILEGLKQIETASQDLIIADPPYFQIVKNKWDNNWENETDYLTWCELWLKECFRVLKENGTLIFKWNEVKFPVKEILKLTDKKPLYGHKSGKKMQTHWICFIKE